MKALIADFQKSSKLFQQTVDNFPVEKRETVLFDKWSLKDIIVHIIGWHKLFLTNLVNLPTGKVPRDWVKIDDFNQKNVANNKSSSFQSVYQELIDIDQQLISQLKSLSPSEWQKKFWPNRAYTPQKILQIEIKHYQKTHLPQINFLKIN